MAEAGLDPLPRFGRPRPLVAAVIAALSLWLHLIAWPTVAPDMIEYVIPWYRHIVETGPVAAFATPFSNYTPAYLYLLAMASLVDPGLAPITVIKLLSVAGTAVLAWSVG